MRIACWLFIISLILALLILGKAFFIPFTVAVLFSFLLLPLSAYMENKGLPREVAIITTLLICFAFLGLLFTFLYYEIMFFVDDAPALKERIDEKILELQRFIATTFNVSRWEQNEWYRQQSDNIKNYSGSYLTDIFTFTGELLAAFALIPIYIFFLTYHRDKIKKFICRAIPDRRNEFILSVARKTVSVSRKYMKGLLIDVLIVSALNATGFMILGLDHAILLGLLTGILNLIPYVGVIIGSIFPFMFAILTMDSSSAAIGSLGVCAVVQFLDNNFITPKVIGSSVSINPLSTLVAIIIGGMLWGIVGMMLFIPLLGMLKVILDSFESTRAYGYLIGEEDDLKPLVRNSGPQKIILLNEPEEGEIPEIRRIHPE